MNGRDLSENQVKPINVYYFTKIAGYINQRYINIIRTNYCMIEAIKCLEMADLSDLASMLTKVNLPFFTIFRGM